MTYTEPRAAQFKFTFFDFLHTFTELLLSCSCQDYFFSFVFICPTLFCTSLRQKRLRTVAKDAFLLAFTDDSHVLQEEERIILEVRWKHLCRPGMILYFFSWRLDRSAASESMFLTSNIIAAGED